MINFKNNSGFTLTEVLIALFVAGVALGPILILQNKSVLSTGSASKSWSRFAAAYDLLLAKAFVPDTNKEKTANKKLSEPLTALRYEQRDMPEASSLKNIPRLALDQVIVDWKERNKRKNYRLISFSFMSEEETHEKKS